MPKIVSAWVLALFFCAVAAGAVLADDVPAGLEAPDLNLEDLISRAKEKNPAIVAARAEWLASAQRPAIDSALPDPTGEYDIMGADRETLVGPEKNRFVIEQDLIFPGKLAARGKMAESEAKAAYQRYRAVRRDQINKLTKLYYDLYYADASLQTLEEIKGLLKNLEGVAQSRYAGLSGAQRDVAKAQAEVSLSMEKLFVLKQQRETLAAMIHALLDEDPMAPLGKASLPEKPILNATLVELVNMAMQNRQEIKEMEALAAKSGHARTLAKLAYVPDLNVGFEWIRVRDNTTNLPEKMDGRNEWMFPLKINVPIWQNRIIPGIKEAERLVEANKSKVVEAKNTAFFEVKDAYYRFQSASQISELYETAVIPQAQIALSADQAGYEGGKSDFLNLLDSERVYLNAKLTQIQIYTEMLKSYADLVRATGLGMDKEREEQEEDAR